MSFSPETPAQRLLSVSDGLKFISTQLMDQGFDLESMDPRTLQHCASNLDALAGNIEWIAETLGEQA